MTSPGFLAYFGFDSPRELPDIEHLEAAGLLNHDDALAGKWAATLGLHEEDDTDGTVVAETGAAAGNRDAACAR